MMMVIVNSMLAFLITTFFLRLSVDQSSACNLISSGLIFSRYVAFGFLVYMISIGGEYYVSFGVFVFVLALVYSCQSSSGIPFAASNLVTATVAVKSNSGLFLVSFFSIIVAFLWTLSWICNFESIMYNSGGDDMMGIVVFLLILSFYWTHQVILNTVYVTVVGTVGSWWFDPISANSCCSAAVCDSCLRASTFSFGSICFGSLLEAIIRVCRSMADNDDEDGALLACLFQCILLCLEDIIDYFNKWAYVYVGLYGYSYLEAGKRVLQLFTSRGCTTIITNNLVGWALILITLEIALLTGVSGYLINCFLLIVSYNFGHNFGGCTDEWAVFCTGFIFGAIGSFVVFNTVVESAVNTIIVCFAESPAEFQSNHPKLCNNMREAWGQMYPDDFS
uniref:Choline transporter-like protein n=2 Tax=Corethron hystrix TaxID=216773 RepID=A0A7S1BBS7_9STRA|mmetsp:Transcript_20756/g.47109  ORF Transcript_20756/g.47109 Transcript_20756/m.47109 type:complete len:392 (+) Transcript_20756:276-1451(+)